MKKLVLIFLIFPLALLATDVPKDIAKNVAINGFRELCQLSNPQVELYKTVEKNDQPVFYIFNLKQGSGFIIVSAEDKVIPILGYSTMNDFGEYPLPPALKELLNLYALEINDLREKNLSGMPKAKQLWNKYKISPDKFQPRKTKSFYLLGNINWDQGCGWNAYCPEDPNGDCGHVYVGCIATAAGMVMKYWGYPPHGIGEHSYQENDYGTLSANFDTTYYWDDMQDNSATDPAALLLFHFGVAVEMDYSVNGSGAYFGDELNALKTYFGYNPDLTFKSKNWYSDNTWIEMLKEQLDAGYPLPYKGYSNSSGGHAFVCDGYNSNNQFHFNWGWSGWYNGYYSINNLNPGGADFSENQAAGFDVYPNPAPVENLTYSIDQNNIVTITWSSPTALKQPAYYKISRDGQWLDNNITDTFFIDNQPLETGLHTYEVKAIYNGFYLYNDYIESNPQAVSLVIADVKNNNDKFIITPNPSKDFITIQSTVNQYVIELIDLQGITLKRINNANKINISQLPKGTYFLKITTKKQQILKKIIKL